MATISTPQGFVGMYDFRETLGTGHFSVVKVAQHVISKRRVAVKIIEKCKLDKDELAHLHHEVRVMKLIRHPHVVRLYQVVDTPSRLYLILELGSGGDLYDYITTNGALPEAQAKDIFVQIAEAVAFCHQHHIVHRDLKPENVVFCSEKNQTDHIVKVTDFGLSNNFSPGEMMKTCVGSLCYSAPEVLMQDPYDGPAADVWSLGVILFMLVTGRLPFSEANESATVTKICDADYSVPDEMPEGCKDLISKMLVKCPNDRISVSAVLSHPWLDGVKIRRDPMDTRLIKQLTSSEHDDIVRTMAKAEIPRDVIESAIKNESYDYVASTYLLLAEQKLRARKDKEAALAAAEGEDTFDSSSRAPPSRPKSAYVTSTSSPGDGETSKVVATGRHTGSLRRREKTITAKPPPFIKPSSMSDLTSLSLSPRFPNDARKSFVIPSPEPHLEGISEDWDPGEAMSPPTTCRRPYTAALNSRPALAPLDLVAEESASGRSSVSSLSSSVSMLDFGTSEEAFMAAQKTTHENSRFCVIS
eukprot:m.289658 g.289658  ORF g.289658 m.289658 type:complete len:529 (+) comp12166_c0_seq1:653-2239(+)